MPYVRSNQNWILVLLKISSYISGFILNYSGYMTPVLIYIHIFWDPFQPCTMNSSSAIFIWTKSVRKKTPQILDKIVFADFFSLWILTDFKLKFIFENRHWYAKFPGVSGSINKIYVLQLVLYLCSQKGKKII